jgi:uncharacterized lipoprotein YbaY
MRALTFLVLVFAFVSPAFAQDDGGISSVSISRCAGRLGQEARGADNAFVTIELDGMPWVTIERTEGEVGSQSISTTVTGSGLLRRRGGTSVPIRYTCLLDTQGQALMVHVANLIATLGDQLPPAVIVSGTVRSREDLKLPRGIELRVQLLDVGRASQPEIVAEQVVRSGWQFPIPFTLRVPKSVSLKDRKLAIAARLVLARETLFRIGPRPLTAAEAARSIELILDKPSSVGR